METIIDDYKKKGIKCKIFSAHSEENLLFDNCGMIKKKGFKDKMVTNPIEFCTKEPISILY